MSGHRPWSEIRRGPSDERRLGELARGAAPHCPLCMDGCEACRPDDERALDDLVAEYATDSVPSYDDLPEQVPWLDRDGPKRDDFAD